MQGFEAIPKETVFFVGAIFVLCIYFHVKFDDKSATHGPTVLTTTGIFATFFGIAIGLFDFNASNIQASVPTLLAGLKTAFWGSVVGVGGALTLKFRELWWGIPTKGQNTITGQVTASDLASLLRSIQQSLVGNDESTLITQLKLARQENNDRLDALRKAQVDALEKLSELSSATLVEALRDVIRDFNDKLTEQFGENFKQLNQAVEKLVIWQVQYMQHVEETSARLSTITGTMEGAAEGFRQLVAHSSTFTSTASDLSKLLVGLEVQRNELTGGLALLAGMITSASDALPKLEPKLMELSTQLASAVSKSQSDLNRALTENAAHLRSTVETSAKEGERVNGEAIKALKEAGDRMRDQVATLDVALTTELTKALDSLGRQLAALSEKFVSDYTPLTDRLRQVIQLAGNTQ